jgi:nucleotidyltransferase substrate binding protein (TIGR01987 family)
MDDDQDRFELAREQFSKAVAALRRALEQLEDEFVRDSIIKRFELCFETARKAMQRWLREQDELNQHSTKKDIFPAALRTGLIQDVDTWNELGAARNDTSHEYDDVKALEIVALARSVGLSAFEALLRELEKR